MVYREPSHHILRRFTMCMYVCVCTRDLRGRLIEVRGVRHVGQALAELAAELTCLSLLIGAGPFPALHSPQLNAFCSKLIKFLWHNVCQVFPSNSDLLLPEVSVPSGPFRGVNDCDKGPFPVRTQMGHFCGKYMMSIMFKTIVVRYPFSTEEVQVLVWSQRLIPNFKHPKHSSDARQVVQKIAILSKRGLTVTNETNTNSFERYIWYCSWTHTFNLCLFKLRHTAWTRYAGFTQQEWAVCIFFWHTC